MKLRTIKSVNEGEYERVFNVTLPDGIVEGSARGKVSITGDLMGPSLSNLDHLIRLPTGCGEQNMLGFVPNIVALSYLTTTDQLTPSVENKAKFNMKRGYQRELNYRHRDGSYSAFGENDPEGSTWLTAFVVRSFAQASDYIYIDKDDLKVSISWLKRLQNPDGCFESRGKLCHKDMKGGVNSERTLTSYVLISLLEAGLNLQNPVVSDALECVTKNLPEVEDTYTLAQLAYALTLAQSPLAQDVMDKLETKAVHEDGLKYWQTNRAKPNGTLNLYANQAPSTDIEMTSYVLLALIGRTTDITQALREGNPIARWIILQRNSNGGFSSTQDTVVALQALAEFAKVAYSEGTSIKAFVEFQPLDDEGSGEVIPFTITTLNRLVLEEETLPSLPAQVTLYASGAGCALLQISTIHNEIPESPEDAGFELDVLVLESYESSKNARCTDYYMKVCARYTGSDEESNMAIIEVKMISGFYPDKESLRLLQKQHKPLQRYEVDNKNIYFYFNELTNEDTCLVFSIVKEIDVEDAKPGVVQVFDYYDKEINVKQLYDITCEDAPPSWDASLLYTIPVKPSEGESFGNAGDMRPLPFVLAALRRVDGLVFIDPPEGSEGAGTGGGGAGGSDVDGGEENVQVDEVDPMDVARELGPPDVYILCPAGQKFVDGLKRCIPINGCESSPCLEGQNCIDTDAGHLCVGCKPGYRKGVADQCVRMPDPGLNQILCGPGQEYINGGCTTVDQCVDNPCPVDARCRSTAFGHTCEPVVCPPGRRLTNDLQCVDIDECLRNPCYEGEVCRNRALGYDCICAEGYERDASINVCVDINECETEIEPCGGPEYICMNDKGSYQCFCVEGYVMDNDGYCIVEVQEPANATRAPQRIGLETTSVPSPQNVTEQTASETSQEGSEQFTEQPQGEVTQNATSQPSTPSPVEENTVTPSAGEETSDAGSSGNSSVAPSSGEVASNASEESGTPGDSVSQSPGNVSSTENVTGSTAAPESGSVTSKNDSSGTAASPAAPDTQGNTITTSPVEEVTSDSGAMRTNGTESPSAGNGSFVTPSAEEGSTQSQNESTTTSAPAEPDASLNSSVTPVAVQETNTTAGEEAVTPSSGDTLGNATVAPIRVTDSQSNATNAPLDATGAPSNTTEAPSNTTEAPSNATEAPSIASDAPGNATVAPIRVTDSQSNATEAPSNTKEVPGGEGGGPDEGKPIIDYGGIKPGTCPVEETGGFSICGGQPCLGDEECSGTQKCCQRSCGKLCMAVAMQVDPIDPVVDIGGPVDVESHPGVCPMDVGDSPMCTGSTCNHDGDCAGSEKCCFDFDCGPDSRCMPSPQIQPVPGPFGPFPVGPKPVVGPETRSGACPDEIGATPFCGGPLCIYDGECDPGEKCCSSATCGEGLICMPAPQIQPVPSMKPREGSCPMMGNCEGQECVMDEDCFDNEKCCGSDCGYRCSLSTIEPPPLPELHLGLCPPVEGEGTCDATVCVQDGNCTMSEKCCVSACGFHCTPAIPFAPPAPIEPLVCPGDRVYLECNSACPEFCGQSLEIALCIQMCEPGCGCPEGTIHLSENSDECVAPDACPVPASTPVPVPISILIQCTEPLVFNECGSACEQTCEKPELQPCTRQCVPGCFCPYGTLRVSLESDLCVSIMLDAPIDLNCPVAEPRPCETERRIKLEERGETEGVFIPQCTPDGFYAMEQCYEGNGTYCWCADPQTGTVLPDSEVHGARANCDRFIPDPSFFNQCPEGKVFADGVKKCVYPEPEPRQPGIPACPGDFVQNDCNSACPEYCGQPEEVGCIQMCMVGCGCPSGKVKASLDSNMCVAPEDCAAGVPEPEPEPLTCVNNLVNKECGTACPLTCNEEEAEMCVAMCVAGCHCPDGMYLVPGDSPRCVAQEECPEPCDEGYKYNEDLECVVANPCHVLLAAVQARMPMPGQFTPTCTSEGKYEMVQCHGSTGFCWCADTETGVKKQGTDVRGTPDCPEPAPTCDEGYKHNEDWECVVANPCHVLLAAVQMADERMVGQFTPMCTSEGKYETVQCHGSTGFCWCADTETGVKKQGTDVRGTPDCTAPVPTCEGEMEFQTCGSACPAVCNEPEQICIFQCVRECQCPSGTLLVREDPPRCVAFEECPSPCDNGMKFSECGKDCQDYCGRPEEGFCNSVCKPGCVCPEGTIRIDLETDMCVPREDCPVLEIPAEIEIEFGGVGPALIFVDCSGSNPCLNGGVCENMACTCLEGFSGDLCDTLSGVGPALIFVDCSGSNPCLNGGTCESMACTCLEGFSGDLCDTRSAVGPALSFVDCSGSNPCLNGGVCENLACTCAPGFSGDLCDSVVCPMVTATTPDDVGQIRTIICDFDHIICPVVTADTMADNKEIVCDFDHIFIVKMRLDGRAKILNDLTTSVNPYASERPIFGFISNDVCNVELTEERYILFMAGEAVNMPGKKFTLDHTVLAMPMTGHIKNEIHELCSVA